MDIRLKAAQLITTVVTQQKSLSLVLEEFKKKYSNPDPLLPALCFETCRWYTQLSWLCDRLTDKPFNKDKEPVIYHLLLIGLLQLIYFRIPDHAVVYETVNSAKVAKKNWATSLINAILRSFLKDKKQWIAKIQDSLPAKTAHPSWLIEKITNAWPAHSQTILDNNNQPAPLAIRVNLQKNSVTTLSDKLMKAGIKNQIIPNISSGLILTTPQPIEKIPGFSEGLFSVQDGAAQLAGQCLEVHPAHTVLDACAAPGGKTCHLLEQVGNIKHLIALDISRQRSSKITDNLKRLRLPAITVITADAAKPDTWNQDLLFDRILLDAPCSATGIIRRQPDVKILRKKSDITHLVQKQKSLLTTLWPLLKPGGILLYTTCSILPEENELLIYDFVRSHNVIPVNVDLPIGHRQKIGHQILPGEGQLDGFFYAKLQKPA